MTRQLQSFEHGSTDYQRPSQDWVCGHAANGAACRLGPDKRGRCRAVAECAPRKDGAGWVCTRPASAGGKCADGPLPDGRCGRPITRCVPLPSLRKRRGRAAAWITTLAVGLLVLALYGPASTSILSPGPTTLQHAEVGGCGSCHADFASGPIGWLHAALGTMSAESESKRCQTCHNMGEHSLSPHGLAPEHLAAVTKAAVMRQSRPGRSINLALAQGLIGKPQLAAESFACASCHNEHQGKQADLTAMSDGRCQSCHAVPFASFAMGHPAFDGYPYERRTPISFDHRSHIQRHFEKAGADKAPGTCTDCHLPSESGGTMVIEPFEKSCGACHTEEIEGTTTAGTKGIPFLTVPGLDLAALEDHGVAIGEWPEISDRKLTPFLEILLSGDEAGRADLERLRSLDLLDLTGATDEDIAAVERLAWAIKGLMNDLLADGLEPVGSRLFAALDRTPDKDLLRRLVATLPQDVLAKAQQEWFPNLFEEVARHRQGLPVKGPEPEAPPADATENEPASAPDAASDGDILSDDQEDILSDDQEILSDDEEILSDDQEGILSDDQEILSDDQDILSDDQEILSDDEGILSEDQETPSDDEGILSDDEGILGGEDAGGSQAPETEPTVEVATEADPVAWSVLGGWYRDFYALFYRPGAHEDSFLRTWLDVSGAVHGTAAEPLARAVFDELTAEAAPGKCAKCHSVDQQPDGSLKVNWRPKLPVPGVQTATRFSHETHFALLDEKGCLTCHRVDPEADYQAAFKQRDPHVFASNFKPIEIETCTECHTADQAGDSCLLCHQYHVGKLPSPFVNTRMQNAMGEAKEAKEPEAQTPSE